MRSVTTSCYVYIYRGRKKVKQEFGIFEYLGFHNLEHFQFNPPRANRHKDETTGREDHREKAIKEMATVSWSDLENRDGVRFSFNCWPDDRQSASKCVVPLGALVTPLKPIAEVPVRVVEI